MPPNAPMAQRSNATRSSRLRLGVPCTNIYDSQANWNQSYAQHNGGWPVCERVTIRYQAPNISFRCGGSPVDSGCDLLGYAGTTQFSMYTGNNAPSGFLAQHMVGKADEIVCD
jgi:hypothetical protein